MKNQTLRICAGIVTYNPEIDRLRENYYQIKKQVEIVVFCDNGSRNLNEVIGLADKDDVVINLHENKGIATALNKLCEYAYENGYTWVMTLDQDSVCPDGFVERLSKHCNEGIAIVGPRIIYEGNEQYSAKYGREIEDVDWVITSGSLTNTEVWKTIGGFDEVLFIDKVDTDYGVRVNAAGYKVRRDNTVLLNHELGNMRCVVLFGRTIYVTNHNPIRIYYQCRNTIYLSKKIGLKKPALETGKIITKIILYENCKSKKLKNAFKGIHDGRLMCKQQT